MTTCGLRRTFGNLAKRLSGDAEDFTFTAGVFPRLPSDIITDKLVILRGTHGYDGATPIEALSFQANRDTYRQLGLLVLAAVFQTRGCRVTLQLAHPRSEIRALTIERDVPKIQRLAPGYHVRPWALRYIPRPIAKHPWFQPGIDPNSFPRFVLAGGDEVRGLGPDSGAARLGELLLNFGSLKSKQAEVVLESEMGFRGVAPGSIEASFHAPGSPAWFADWWK